MRAWIRSVLLALTAMFWRASLAFAAQGDVVTAGGGSNDIFRVVGLAAAAATAVSLSVLGASYAVGRIGAAALGAAAEKPELLPRSLLFVALAEGLAVLGFALAMVLVQKI